MTTKYRIELMESERGWGQDYWHEDYDTYEEAKDRIKTVNARNTLEVAPDWYMQAYPDIKVVEVD